VGTCGTVMLWVSGADPMRTSGRDQYCYCPNMDSHLVVLLVCCQSLHCHGHAFQLIHECLQLLLMLFAIGTRLCMHTCSVSFNARDKRCLDCHCDA
jgi:hypothetical protein